MSGVAAFDSEFKRVGALLASQEEKGQWAALYDYLRQGLVPLSTLTTTQAVSEFLKLKMSVFEALKEDALLQPVNLPALLERDPHLASFKRRICERYSTYAKLLDRINRYEGGILEFANGFRKRGLQPVEGGIQYREWAPGAQGVSITGAFCDWDRDKHTCTRDEFGVWSVFIPNKEDGTQPIPCGSAVKVCVTQQDGQRVDRISPWVTRAVQVKEKPVYEAQYEPISDYTWKHPRPPRPQSLRIYEAHVGISGEEEGIASYRHFADTVIPRIAALGYNSIQLMAVMEHAYYASFGYQVTSFFAASSRYGPSEDLKYLVDVAHSYNIQVLLDVVHSHASKNVLDGLNQFDGTDGCYFHTGPRGHHPQWDSRLFDYAQWEVMRFLLSNLRFYMEVYGFDGFRFDGVTSMLYHHHGLSHVFTQYQDYFGPGADDEAAVYLMLANQLVHEFMESAVTIAEDVSGMPALCRPQDEGGLGFDYRLSMAVPDMWIKLLKEKSDDEWDMGLIVHTLENRRYKEPSIAYTESHDQALVGDKSLAFWLMDQEMYTHMSVLSEPSLIVDRGIALHKMIRLLTHALGGEGYLNFMGNEFGHPEWLDFPRLGNNDSYKYARRQWHLVDDHLLRYKFLNEFDKAMQHTEAKYGWLAAPPAFVSCKHEGDKVIVFERAGLVFAFNFHPTKSFTDYRVGVAEQGVYTPCLTTDETDFGGTDRIKATEHFSEATPWHDRPASILLYLPSRTAVVLSHQ
eukprot:m.360513 g.360513  ORF g.360513 m.360513 type:complete len:742 (+) comp19073_c0_seq1:41-2266(+)